MRTVSTAATNGSHFPALPHRPSPLFLPSVSLLLSPSLPSRLSAPPLLYPLPDLSSDPSRPSPYLPFVSGFLFFLFLNILTLLFLSFFTLFSSNLASRSFSPYPLLLFLPSLYLLSFPALPLLFTFLVFPSLLPSYPHLLSPLHIPFSFPKTAFPLLLIPTFPTFLLPSFPTFSPFPFNPSRAPSSPPPPLPFPMPKPSPLVPPSPPSHPNTRHSVRGVWPWAVTRHCSVLFFTDCVQTYFGITMTR